MAALKPLEASKTVSLKLDLPKDLNNRIESVRREAEAAGFALEVDAAAISGIRRYLTSAEKELASLKKPAAVEKKPVPASASASVGAKTK